MEETWREGEIEDGGACDGDVASRGDKLSGVPSESKPYDYIT